ncbi:hypothetical protein ccbrp13_62850 [Ktedonobacteria bacterium brp13]|nr:hypothetical protein ccbrp13_62850 [Ktedonobacteria bacterium brp13]
MPWYPPPEEAVKFCTVPTRTLSVLRGRMPLALLFLRKDKPEEVEYHQTLMYHAVRWLADVNVCPCNLLNNCL